MGHWLLLDLDHTPSAARAEELLAAAIEMMKFHCEGISLRPRRGVEYNVMLARQMKLADVIGEFRLIEARAWALGYPAEASQLAAWIQRGHDLVTHRIQEPSVPTRLIAWLRGRA